MFSEYEHDGNIQAGDLQFTFDFDSPGITKIRKKWNIEDIMGGGSELQKIAKLKKWAYRMLSFGDKELESRRYETLDCFEVIDVAKQEGYSLNCRYMSLIFTQILLAAGFKARWVSCLPMELNYCECHCITEVFVNECNKWIVVDVAFDLFYFDRKGNLLNLFEIRQHILRNEMFRIPTVNNNVIKYVWEYWTRHVFRFKYLLDNKYNMLASPNKVFVFLNPINFIVNDKEIIHSSDDTTKYKQLYNHKYFW